MSDRYRHHRGRRAAIAAQDEARSREHLLELLSALKLLTVKLVNRA